MQLERKAVQRRCSAAAAAAVGVLRVLGEEQRGRPEFLWPGVLFIHSTSGPAGVCRLYFAQAQRGTCCDIERGNSGTMQDGIPESCSLLDFSAGRSADVHTPLLKMELKGG